MPFVPKGVECNWKLNVDEIKALTSEIVEKSKQIYDEVGALEKEDVNLENVLMKLAYEEYEYYVQAKNVTFPRHTAEDKVIRATSTESDKLLSQLEVDQSMRQDVFHNLVALKEKGFEMTSEQNRYLDRLIRDGKRNGLHLGSDIQDEVKRRNKQISDLEIEFSKNLNEENTILLFTPDELRGLPEDFISSLDKIIKYQIGRVELSLKYHHYFPCIRNGSNPVFREKLLFAFYRRCIMENSKIQNKLAKTRYKRANLLGYANHADFVTEILMSKTSATVKKFVEDLGEKLDQPGKSDLALMLTFKKEECAKLGIPYDKKINYWDIDYYMNMVKKENYSVDHEKIKEYFPMEVVTKGLLEIYQELLSLKFELIPNAEVWHADVTMYQVVDSVSSELMGYFYLDLFPREGKFGHDACFRLQSGCLKKDGSRMLSVAAMVANLPKPIASKPSLLTHDDVVTFFHEFGHVMHTLCAVTDLSRFSETSVESDFVEAPSQMLENWAWEKEALKRISSHYEDNSKLPDNMIDALIKSRNAFSGYLTLRQVFLATFDLTIDTREKSGCGAIFSMLSHIIFDIVPPRGSNFPAGWGHMCGYDSRYYGYLWSEVLSMDMFATCFKSDGIFNKDIGMKYRNLVLKPGGSIDATEIIKNFLGREPNDKAFLISKGLQLDSAVQEQKQM